MISTTERPLTMPDDLSSPQTKLVYLSLVATDEATVSDLEHLLDLPKLSLLPTLQSLVEAGLVQRTDGRYTCR